jgi:hypothetical protein
MQVVRLLLRQHHLSHLQFHLQQAKDDLVLLQPPAEADELFRLGTKRAHPGKVVLLGSLVLDATDITFHVHPPKGTLECH